MSKIASRTHPRPTHIKHVNGARTAATLRQCGSVGVDVDAAICGNINLCSL